jgi:hypothetical protein
MKNLKSVLFTLLLATFTTTSFAQNADEIISK